MNAPFARAPSTFDDFFRLGYKRLVPVIPPSAPLSERSSLFKRVGTSQDGRGKTPGVRGADGLWYSFDWTKHEADEHDIVRWAKMGASIGVKMGGELYFIDADTMDKALAALIHMTLVKHFGVLSSRIGNFPKAGYPIRVSSQIPYQRVEFGDGERVEILGEGRHAVFAGTHPKTSMPYAWAIKLVPFDELPVVSPAQITAFLEELRTLLPSAKPVIIEGGGADVPQASLWGNLEDVRKAVQATPNTSATFGTREAYLGYGYAIRAALPDNEPEAFELFADWCARWTEGDNDPDVVAADWRRMKSPYRRGASYIYELAEQQNPTEFRKVDLFFDVIEEPEPLFVDSATATGAKTDTYPLLRTGDIVNRPPLVYLIKRHIPEIGVGFLYARPGAGKSFLALDIALHIAYGRPSWHGDAIAARDDAVVIYIAAEGSFGFRNRILAWQKRHGVDTHSERFLLIERTVNFMAKDDVDKLLRTVGGVGVRPALIVVDTVSRAIPGADENLQKDMTTFVAACDRLKDAHQCAILGVHHAGKSGDMRGSTVLAGAGDFVFMLDRKEGAGVGRLHCQKQKDGGPDGWQDPYRFDVVALDAGETSLVPARCDQSISPGKALTPLLATDVFKAMAAAWDEGEPWGSTYHSGDRRASTVMSRVFDIEAGKADELLRLWTDAGDIVLDIRDKKTRLKGYRVVRAINPEFPASDGGIFA